MTEHFFDLKGVDTGKVGNNKYVNYKLSDFIEDQNISPSAGVKALEGAGYNLRDLNVVPRETRLGRFLQPINPKKDRKGGSSFNAGGNSKKDGANSPN